MHLGHALNHGLKDFVVKSKTMAGFNSPYVPGFDCHGLPIEIKVDEQLGRKKLELPAVAVLEACRAYAQKYVDLQTSQLERIGIFGRWDKPYKTMSRDYEARTLEAFYGFLEKGFVYRGLKPVYWCINDRTALAEAEVEYENHTSPSVYVRYKLTSDPASIDPALAGREVYTIIWTTTPWTLPASLAVAFHPDFDYVAITATPAPGAPGPSHLGTGESTNHNPVYIVAAELAASVAAATGNGPNRPSWPASKARCSTASPSSTLSSIAASSACWPPTSPPTPAPAPSTPRPPTAQTTSTPASATASTPRPRGRLRPHPRR
jgi:isoleucyl-tRNA synthetase